MNGLQGILQCLEHVGHGTGEITVPEPTRSDALLCIERMLNFTQQHPELLAKAQHGFVKNIGAA